MVGKGTLRTKEEKARIVMEVLSNSSTIAEICRKYNVASSAVYRWRDEFISAGTAAMEQGKSTVEQSLMRKVDQLKGIIGELTSENIIDSYLEASHDRPVMDILDHLLSEELKHKLSRKTENMLNWSGFHHLTVHCRILLAYCLEKAFKTFLLP